MLYVGIQTLESYVLTPIVQKKTVSLPKRRANAVEDADRALRSEGSGTTNGGVTTSFANGGALDPTRP